MKRLVIVGLFVALVALALAATACEDEENGSGKATSTSPGETPAGDATPTVKAQAQQITIVASDSFAFDPDDLTLTAGTPVVLTLDNSGAAIEHDFTSDDLPASDVVEEGGGHESDAEVHVSADGGETGALEFTPAEPGEYTFYCSVEGHRDAGMEGTITVE